MSGPGLNSEQRRAIAPDASIWVSASAGAGKTHVLTARLLRLMLEGVTPEKLLCLTFTRAAAAEMANRLRDKLGLWTRLDDRALDADIHKSCDMEADETIRQRARRLFAMVLDLADGLRIDTIHAFCQALLARFPIEAGLSPHFDLVEDSKAAELLLQTRNRLIGRARKERRGPLASALATIAGEVNEEDFSKLIDAILKERRHLKTLLDPVEGYGSLTGLLAATRNALGLQDGDSEEALIADALSDDRLPVAGIRRLAAALRAHGAAAEADGAGAALAMLEAPLGLRAALYPDYRLLFLTKEGAPRKTTRYPTKRVREADPDLPDIIESEAGRLAALEERIKQVKVLAFTRAALTLGARMLDSYEEEKRLRGLLDYDDLIHHTARLLAIEGIAPWILYKLDAGITHVLVDEAQDTNPEQWAVIEALTAEFFVGETARAERRTVFAVGDVKQSIYGFQGADPRAFIAARDRMFQAAAGIGAPHATVPLDLSFRSTPQVLALVDAVFADPRAASGLTLDDQAIRHRSHRADDGGLVELWPLEPVAESAEPAPWEPPVAQEASESAEARLAVRIARHIASMVKGREPLPSEGRPIEPGDVMVLVRRRTGFVDLLVKALKQRDIPVAGSDRLKLGGHLGVRDLLALAAVCLLPEDDLTLGAVLKGPAIAMREEALFALAHDRGTRSLWAALQQAARSEPLYRAARDRIEEFRSIADKTPPFEFFTDALSRGGLRTALHARLGPEVHDPLDELLRLARDYERDHPPSLQGFLHFIDRGESEIKRESEHGRNEVRIMTVHGAKGLQAPIVYLPDTSRLPQPRNGLLRIPPRAPVLRPDLPLLVWRGNSGALEAGPVSAASEAVKSRENEEYRRLLYVALTRAADRLIVAGWEMKQKQDGNWYDLISAGFDRLDAVETIEEGGRTLRRLRSDQRRVVAPPALERLLDEGLAIPDWLHRPPPTEATPPRPLAPSRPEEEPSVDSPLAGSRAAALLRGGLVHDLLENLPLLPVAERRAAAARYLGRSAFALEPPMAEDIARDVFAILEDAAFAPIFGPDSLAEAPVAGIVGAHVVSGQIDRLLIAPERIMIIDYKTNRRPPSRPEDTPDAYLRQMAAYRAVLQQIWSDRPVETALLWVSGPTLMALPGALLDRHLPR